MRRTRHARFVVSPCGCGHFLGYAAVALYFLYLVAQFWKWSSDQSRDAVFPSQPAEAVVDWASRRAEARLLDSEDPRLTLEKAEACAERVHGECGSWRRGIHRNFPASHVAWVARIGQNSLGYAHMAMLERLGSGRLVAAWQGASDFYEGSRSQQIFLSFALDQEGKMWSPALPLPHHTGNARWAPVLHFCGLTERLFVFYAESQDCFRPATARTPPRSTPGGDIRVMVASSPPFLHGDWGSRPERLYWDAPRTLLSQNSGRPIPNVLANKLAVLASGAWVLPFWREKAATGACNNSAPAYASVLVSRDSGRSWVAGGRESAIVANDTWLIEHSVVQLEGGDLLMHFRTGLGVLARSESRDEGRSWSAARLSAIPNPNSKASVVRLEDGRLAMAFNAHARSHGPLHTSRSLLDVALSHDGGRTWKRIARLDNDLRPGLMSSYPSMQQVGGVLYVVFSRLEYWGGAAARKDWVNRSRRDDLGIRLMSVDLPRLVRS